MQPQVENFHFTKHGAGAAATAALKIVEGQIIKLVSFNREPSNCREFIHTETAYFGLHDIDGRPALRISSCRDLEADGSSSIIGSYVPHAKNPVFIAAVITEYLSRSGTDFFIDM